jgi:hypothetical protein
MPRKQGKSYGNPSKPKGQVKCLISVNILDLLKGSMLLAEVKWSYGNNTQ